MEAKVTRELSYLDCVKRVCGDKYILCNNLEKDESFMNDLCIALEERKDFGINQMIEGIEVLEDAEKLMQEYCIEDDVIEDCETLDDIKEALSEELQEVLDHEDIYQYYLTACTGFDVEYNEKQLNNALFFVYNEKLDLYVLCVTHCGTPWNSVHGATIKEG